MCWWQSGADREDLIDMLAELRELDPKPGRGFETGPVESVVPDVFVRPGPHGSWLVELNSDTLPKVLVNQAYYARVASSTKKEADKTYLGDCLQNAAWLVRALDQRAKTILKVATEIVRQQEAFLIDGVEHLRPPWGVLGQVRKIVLESPGIGQQMLANQRCL